VHAGAPRCEPRGGLTDGMAPWFPAPCFAVTRLPVTRLQRPVHQRAPRSADPDRCVTVVFVWWRASVAGQVLDLLHARIAEPYAPHLHEQFAVGACVTGVELIRYRGATHRSGPGSVVVLGPGEPHTGGPSEPSGFVYRAMYPSAALLADASGRVPCFGEPVIDDPVLADGLCRLHAALCRGIEPIEAESRVSWLLGELARRHACVAWPGGCEVRAPGAVARFVMGRLGDQMSCPPALAEIALETGLSRYQLVRSFRSEVGMPPYAWLAQHRVARARALLDRGHGLAETAALAGFADQPHLTRWFRRVVGITPGAYRNAVQDTP
jgi:AraC-like DNA-binding protein